MMRVLVTISEAHPELLEELRALDARHRAERLRVLAFSGLKMKQIPHTSASSQPVMRQAKKKVQSEQKIQDAMSAGLKHLESIGT